MNTQTIKNNILNTKRPILLTVFCVFYVFSFTWQFIELLLPSGYANAIANLPPWFVLSQLILFYPLGLASMLGIWKMHKWGVYLFGALIVFSMTLMYYGLHLLPHLKALSYLLVFFVASLIYLRRME